MKDVKDKKHKMAVLKDLYDWSIKKMGEKKSGDDNEDEDEDEYKKAAQKPAGILTISIGK